MFVEALTGGIDEAASGLAGIGSAVAAGNAAGAAPTLGVVPPAPSLPRFCWPRRSPRTAACTRRLRRSGR